MVIVEYNMESGYRLSFIITRTYIASGYSVKSECLFVVLLQFYQTDVLFRSMVFLRKYHALW